MHMCVCVCVYIYMCVCIMCICISYLLNIYIYIHYICFSPCCFLIKKKTISEITLSPYTLEFQCFF